MIAELLLDAGRAGVWLGLLAIIFVPLERLAAERPQPVRRHQLGVDLVYYLLNGIVTVAVVAALGGLLAALAHRVLPGAVLDFTGHLPTGALIALTLIVNEFGTYWGHRWSHEMPLLWRFHAIHHSATQVDWLTSSRGHPVDLIFTRICGLTLVCGLGLARPYDGDLGIPVMLLNVFAIVWGYFVHANLRWRFGWLESVIATPAFHRWHHTNDAFRDHNYASTLPLYDRLFGTWHLPQDQIPPVFGIDQPGEETVIGQLIAPLRVHRPMSPDSPR
jgi:sterol desaturase/sphingolipid hydroxylase (fatty acid hydroxylase superfamily)